MGCDEKVEGLEREVGVRSLRSLDFYVWWVINCGRTLST